MAENKRHKGHRQRMRERVQSYGLDSLAEHEALEYVLYLTNAQKDTNGIAHDLIDRFGILRRCWRPVRRNCAPWRA